MAYDPIPVLRRIVCVRGGAIKVEQQNVVLIVNKNVGC